MMNLDTGTPQHGTPRLVITKCFRPATRRSPSWARLWQSICLTRKYLLLGSLSLLSASTYACLHEGRSYPCSTDCIEDGGQMQCTDPAPSKWQYSICVNRATPITLWMTNCVAAGGQVLDTDNNGVSECVGAPPTTENSGESFSTNFSNLWYASCPPAPPAVATAWGVVDNDINCGQYWPQATRGKIEPEYKSGFLVKDYRRFSLSGKLKDPWGACTRDEEIKIFLSRDRSVSCPQGYATRYAPNI